MTGMCTVQDISQYIFTALWLLHTVHDAVKMHQKVLTLFSTSFGNEQYAHPHAGFLEDCVLHFKKNYIYFPSYIK